MNIRQALFTLVLPLATLASIPGCQGEAPAASPLLAESSSYLWYCDAESDPDYAVADIQRQGNGLIARVTQESGDGDEGGFELVPVMETIDGDLYVYKQAGQAKLENGKRGKTKGLYMEIAVTKRESRRADAEGYLALQSGPTGQGADENNTVSCANYNYLDVVKRVEVKPLRDLEVDMGSKDVAMILVPYAGGLPEVTWEDVTLCDEVTIWTVEKYGSNTRIRVEPSFGMDDGANTCRIKIIQPDGTSGNVDLSYFIDG